MLKIHSIVDKENNKPKRMIEREKRAGPNGWKDRKKKPGPKGQQGLVRLMELVGLVELIELVGIVKLVELVRLKLWGSPECAGLPSWWRIYPDTHLDSKYRLKVMNKITINYNSKINRISHSPSCHMWGLLCEGAPPVRSS